MCKWTGQVQCNEGVRTDQEPKKSVCSLSPSLCMCVCVSVCVCEREDKRIPDQLFNSNRRSSDGPNTFFPPNYFVVVLMLLLLFILLLYYKVVYVGIFVKKIWTIYLYIFSSMNEAMTAFLHWKFHKFSRILEWKEFEVKPKTNIFLSK